RLPAAGRPRHRPHQQIEGVQAAGAGIGYGGGECSIGVSPGSAGLRHRRPDPEGHRSAENPPAHQQSPQNRGAGRLRHRSGRAGAAAGGVQQGQRQVHAHEEGKDGPPAQSAAGAQVTKTVEQLTNQPTTIHQPTNNHQAIRPKRNGRDPSMACKQYEGKLVSEKARYGIVAGRFNAFIPGKLLAGALDGLRRHGAAEDDIEVAWVPGSFEIPLAAQKMAESGKYDAVLALGAVIRGSTPHFDYVAAEVAKGVAQVSLKTGIPGIFGVLTTEIGRTSCRETGER